MWDLRTFFSHTQRHKAACTKIPERVTAWSYHLRVKNTWVHIYIAINRKACIFYICAYTHTAPFCMSVHTVSNYCHCGMWLSYHELWEHINSSTHLHLWYSFLHCVQRFWCHTFLHTLLVLLLSNPFPKVELRNYDKFIFKCSWKVSRAWTWHSLNLQMSLKSDSSRTIESVIKTCR